MRKPAQVDELDIELTFEGFKTFGEKSLIEAVDACKEFCADMASADKPARWLTLLGPSGVGKTDLLRRVAGFFRRHLDYLCDERSSHNENWIRKGGFKNWANIIGDMNGWDYSGLSMIKGDWFLALDDIGTERSKSDFAVSKLYEILNSREGLFTAINANLPLEQIAEKMDTRIASRLLRNNSMLVDIEAIDYNRR